MSASERERSHVMRALKKGLLRQREAAERLGLGVRQIKRLLRAWRTDGDAGLISRQRGRASPRRMDTARCDRIEDLLRGQYPDFGATLAAEKLREREGIEVSRGRCAGFRSIWVWRGRSDGDPPGFIRRANADLALAN